MKYLSMFSGIGGFELGIQQVYKEAQNIGYSEIDKYAIQIYEKHFKQEEIRILGSESTDQKSKPPQSKIQLGGERSSLEEGDSLLPTNNRGIGTISGDERITTHKNYGDATKINERELPDFDLLVGGFPCQAFSIAGQRKGFDDTRGTLFFDIARILAHKRPRHLLLENVKGLLSHDKGKTFQTILGVLSDLGYRVEWQILNSKNHGVPQNRERIFFIGHLRGECGGKVFPIEEGGEVDNGQDAQGNAYCLQAGGDKHRGTYIKQLNNPTHSNNRIYGEEGIGPTLNTAQGGNRQPKIVAHYGHKNKVATVHDISPTLKAQSHGHEPMLRDGRDNRSVLRAGRTTEVGYAGQSIRRLTPTECERLQGFPDGWTEGLSDNQRYKTLGNAVTVNVIRNIILNFECLV